MHFLFDLDSTITKTEILPFIATEAGCDKTIISKLDEMTLKSMNGELPFEVNFRKRVNMLSHLPIQKIQKIVSTIPLHKNICNFLQKYKKQCSIITSNLDIWIKTLVENLGINCYSSKAQIDKTYIQEIEIIRKKDVLKNFKTHVIAIGDGSNDVELLDCALIGIAYGGARKKLPDSLLEVANYAIYSEKSLCILLQQILNNKGN